MNRWACVGALALGATLTVTGCTAVAPTPSPSPTASAPAEASVPALGSLDEIAGTRWLVDDSQGDRTTVIFGTDGSVSYVSYGDSFAYPEDTWTLVGDTLTWQLTYGARYGVWTCSGTFDSASQVLSGTWTSTIGESGTLSAVQPIR
ncbi:MAG: hypothetical protein KF761_00190 [Salinibacterium sp.]|nr:hypothetical protein [Salinibacterium sp.]